MTKRVAGKQFANNTIEQNHLNLTTPVYSYDATIKEYVDNNVNDSKSIERESSSNLIMLANSGSTSTYLACNIAIVDDPIFDTVVDVYLNGIQVSIGDGYDCYFSPDGIIKRSIADVRIADKLYWDYTVANYHLESDDVFDFKYLTNDSQIQIINLNNGDSVEITSDNNIVVLKFTGEVGESATVIITGVSFSVGNTVSGFTFDIGDTNGLLHVFTYISENYEFYISGLSYSINWDGEGSIVFSVITKNNFYDLYGHKVIINLNYGGYYFYACTSNNERLDILKDWIFIIGTMRGGIGWWDGKLLIYNKINDVWVKTQEIYHESDYYPTIVSTDKTGSMRFILKRYRVTGSAEKAQTYILSGSTWVKEPNGIDYPALDISALGLYGNNVVISNRVYNDGNPNNGIMWTFHNSGGTWWGPYTIYSPAVSQRFGYSAVIYDDFLSVHSKIDNKLHMYYTTDSGQTWINRQEITGHTQTITGLFDYSNTVQIIGDKMMVSMDENTLVMWEFSGRTNGNPSGGTWVEYPFNLSAFPLTGGTYEVGTFVWTSEDIIFIPLVVPKENLHLYSSKTYIYQKINGVWEATVLKNVYPQYRNGGYGFYHSAGSGATFYCPWQDYNEILENQDYFTVLTECGRLTSSNTILARNLNSSAVGLELVKTNNTINLSYDYSHIYGYIEKDSLIKWYSEDNWVTGSTQITEYNGLSVKIDTLTSGKLISVKVNAKDENGILDIYQSHSNKLWVYDDDNEVFNTTSIDSAIIKLTVINGSIGSGVTSIETGVYNISANTTFSQSLTTTVWNFNATSIIIGLNGYSSYGAIVLNVNGSGYSNTLSGTYNGVPDAFFTQYIIGGVTFTIEKGPGWKFYN